MISQLTYNENTDRIEFDGYGLHCGDGLTVLIVDEKTGKTKWVETCIEYSDRWYLVGLSKYQVNGLFAKM